MFVLCEGTVRVAAGLPRAEGRKGSAARGEGRSPVATTKSPNEASCRPSGQRVAAPFQAADAARQADSGSWFAPVGALRSKLPPMFPLAFRAENVV